MAYRLHDDDDDGDDDGDWGPWAPSDDEPEVGERGESDDGPTDADRWLDQQLGRLRPPPRSTPRPDAIVLDGVGPTDDRRVGPRTAAEPAAPVGALSATGIDRSDEVVLRHPAPTRPPRRRRRADPDGVADLPAAVVSGYVRDRRGTWRYSATGQAVPGARDLTLRSLYRFPARRGHVLVPVDRVRSETELGWCMAWKQTLSTSLSTGHLVTVLRVPVDEWERRADIPFGLWAPELTPARLLGVADVARIAGVTPATITAYLSRRRMPPPVARIGNSPVWSRPVIHHWLATRPGQGARPHR